MCENYVEIVRLQKIAPKCIEYIPLNNTVASRSLLKTMSGGKKINLSYLQKLLKLIKLELT